MAPDMLLGLDKARKEELHNDAVDAVRCGIFGVPSRLSSLMLVEMDSGKLIHCSSDAIISIKDDMKMEVRENYFTSIPPITWSVKIETAKQIRRFRNFRRELGLKKPRIPRKLKKKLKTDIKLMRYEETE